MTDTPVREQSPLPRGCAHVFLVVFVLCWTGTVLTADGKFGRVLYRQARAEGFPRAEGTITQSTVEQGESSRLNIAYSYEVNGQIYTGTRYWYGGVSNSSNWQRACDELPVGARVLVAYDPADPSDAVLRPGLFEPHTVLIWFFTPFNIVMLAGWLILARGERPAFGPHVFTVTPNGVRTRLPGLNRTGAFAGTLLGISFVGSFVWGCGCGFNPPLLLSGYGYLAAIAFAVWVAIRHVTPVLEVNQLERVVQIVTGRKPVVVPFEAVREIRILHEETLDSDAADGKDHKYHCELRHTNTNEDSWVRIATYNEPASAEGLAMWLRGEVGHPEQPKAK
ncbi:DUF3592 domain-containing protein [Gemmata sp. JC673]|uniref:DUF3592 domain-containing protein n=1 Tax=Gemmata algarum TaxID=2975278 RepID=A0ABU5F4F7_9BACT|nr:DUF3592 domain-containing protein [Gemmata algarum]MDY3562435.1 DUF3592 domain-containing protein [Gemmata algarum]